MRPPSSRGRRAFLDVSVVDLAQGSILEHQQVVTEGERILTVGPAAGGSLPPKTRVVSRSGGFLMPGLTDLHVHVDGEAPMLLFLLHGVTTVRNMWGLARHLRWRDAIDSGRLLGPTIYTTGPIVDGSPPYWNLCVPVATPEEAVREVRRQKAAGFSAVKVYGRLSAAAYAAIVKEAAAQGLPVVGHVPRAIPLQEALRAGQHSVEHLEGWFEAVQADRAPWKGRPMTVEEYAQAHDYVDPSLIPRVAAEVAASTSWSCPTLVVYESFCSPAQLTDRLARPEMRWCPPSLLARWDPSKDFRFAALPQSFWDRIPAVLAFRRDGVRALRSAGARLLIGTDTANPWVVPGVSLHHEMERLVECGYSTREVLQMATQGAAEFLGTPGEFGVVAPGARADLLLLEGNPLDDLAFARQPRGVMVRGSWLSEVELERLSGELLRSYGTAPLRVRAAMDRAGALGTAPPRTYTVSSDGVFLGWERVWGPEAGADRRQRARLVLDAPPGVSTIDTDWSFDASGRVRRARCKLTFFEGREAIGISRSRSGFAILDSTAGASGGCVGEVAARADALVGPVQAASVLPLVAALRAIGHEEVLKRDVVRIETSTVQVARGELTARREPGAPPAGPNADRFAMEEIWTNGRFSGEVQLSSEGELVGMRWRDGSSDRVWTLTQVGDT